jgi:PKD repeat protein
MKKWLLYVLLLTTFTTCTKQNQGDSIPKPITNFVVYNNNCKASCNIAFTNTTRSTYDTEYLWTFGDGDSSRLENPVHRYDYGGTYNVELVAKNKAGFGFMNKSITIQSDLPLGLFDLCRVERITYIKVPPAKPDGSPWDDLPGSSALPDLQWLVRDTTRTFMRSQELSQLVNFDQKLLPLIVPREGLSGSLRQFDRVYTLVVQDADENGPEIIGSFRFRPIDYFPAQPDKATSASTSISEFILKSDYGLEVKVTLFWQ